MNLDNVLLQLENASLVRRLDELEPTFAFKHTLTQETAHDSLLKTKRAELHRQVAVAIEQQFPDQLEQNAAMLTLHYEQAGIDDKAFIYALMAGDLARRAYANREALSFYDRALQLASRLDDPELRARVRRVYADRGKVLEVGGDFGDALQNYHQMVDHARRLHDLSMEAEGIGLLLSTESVLGDVRDAEPRFEQAIQLARRSGDQELIGRALWSFGLSLRFKDPRRAIDYIRQALEIARAADLAELAALALVDLIIAMQFAGQLEQFIDYSQQALQEFRTLDNRSMVANCLGMLADAYHARGEVARARSSAQEGLEISEAIENPWGIGYNTWVLMATDTEAGRFDRALEQISILETVMDKIPIPLLEGVSRLRIAQIYLELNQLNRAYTLATEALEILARLESPAWAFWGRGAVASVLTRQGRLDEAHAMLEPLRRSMPETAASRWVLGMVAPAALELGLIEGRLEQELAFFNRLFAQVNLEPVQAFVAESLYLRGQVYFKLGDWARSGADFDRAREIAVRAENNLLLWRIEEALAQLYAARGDQDRGQAAHERAVALIQRIAKNISDPVLRASFLRRRDIQVVLSA